MIYPIRSNLDVAIDYSYILGQKVYVHGHGHAHAHDYDYDPKVLPDQTIRELVRILPADREFAYLGRSGFSGPVELAAMPGSI